MLLNFEDERKKRNTVNILDKWNTQQWHCGDGVTEGNHNATDFGTGEFSL